jgi:hypothetical protein
MAAFATAMSYGVTDRAMEAREAAGSAAAHTARLKKCGLLMMKLHSL